MPHSKLQYLPIILGTLLPVTFIWTYIIAVLLGHVEPGFPYISAAGNQPPESCFFGQMLNICAALMSLCVYIRHRQLVSQEASHRPPKKLLLSALWTGMLASLGVSMVANFQLESLIVFHGIGAVLAFGVGIPFLWIQVACTAYDPPDKYSKVLIKTRAVFAGLSTFFLVVVLIGNSASHIMEWIGIVNEIQFGLYLMSAIGEWIMAVAMAAFVVTFAQEFQHISLMAPQVVPKTASSENDAAVNED